jgi:serine/threonine-protein kinase RsbW
MQTLEDTFAGVFSGVPEQIRQVRGQVRDFLDRCPAADDAVLVVSELATNATVHSLSGNGTFTVRVKRCDTYVHVEVEDAGGPWVPASRDDRPHGLDIVSVLAREWGINSAVPGRRVVWARIGC